MCGITGILDLGGTGPVTHDQLEPMVEVLRHRGPDDDGRYLGDGVALGMRRLSIIDVAGGAQPMSDESGRVQVVCNGEIYNYRELRDRLVRRGHRFTSDADTEVVAHLYEEHGAGLVEHLRGMFALAVWDADRQQLLLARDRLGIKPLYLRHVRGRLTFGSEIKSLLPDMSGAPEPDLEAVGLYLALKYVPSPRTMFAGVQSLPPGCLAVCDAGGVTVRRYWDVEPQPVGTGADLEEQAERLAALLRESVRLHLQSDVPFGAFLSGGLDSSLVVGLMSEVLPTPVRTFSVGFVAAGVPSGELSYAAAVAERFGTEHRELRVTGEDFVAAAERAVWHLDQPIGDLASVPMLLLSEMAAQDVKMVLSGEGGDELFAGYARYVGESFAPMLRPLPPRVRARALTALQDRAAGPRPKIALHALSKSDDTRRLVNWFPMFDDCALSALVSPELAALSRSDAAERVFAGALARSRPGDRLSEMLYVDTTLWLPDLLLARADKVSMAASLELRVPLLDHRVVEFAAALPSSMKLRRLTRKLLLREVARDVVPPIVLDRRKEGFPVPGSTWLRHEAADLVRDTLDVAAVRRRGLLQPVEVTRLVDEHLTGQADHGNQLWGLVALELWFRQYVDQAVRPPQPAGRC